MSKKPIPGPSLIVPERRIQMSDGSYLLFRADNRAWYTLEKKSGKTLMEFLSGLDGDVPLSAIYDLAWAMSSSGRMREQRSEDFDGFLDLLPPLTDAQAFLQPMMDLLAEAFSGNEGARGNGPTPRQTALG